MKGCTGYSKICTPESVVKQCKTYPPLPYLPTTKEAASLVKSICSEMDMTGCEKCSFTTQWQQYSSSQSEWHLKRRAPPCKALD
ncbi:hypothetical protein HDU76_011864, partial [Blyttiomyces sp. JEL0837]